MSELSERAKERQRAWNDLRAAQANLGEAVYKHWPQKDIDTLTRYVDEAHQHCKEVWKG